jgi:glucose-1-phosphate thymidylyltransferase
MIFYPIHKLKEAGITEILIVTGTDHMGAIVNLLGSGKDYGVKFTYKVQDEAGGIAQALGLAENFVGNDKMTVILGDNIFEMPISNIVKDFEKQERGAKILIKKVPDPARYGVPTLQGDRIVKITEKPKHPESDYCVTGIYMYDSRVFEIIKNLKPSNRGELEITDVNNHYILENSMTYGILDGWWTDAGTHESLEHATVLAQKMKLVIS